MNYYYDSEGNKYNQRQINSKYSLEKRGWMCNYVCEAFGSPHISHDWDHSIAQARCKTLHKTELIWLRGNVVRSSRVAHMEWESFKSGRFSFHNNAYERMIFTGIHDPEKFKARFHYITNEGLKERLQNLYDTIDD